MGSRFTAEGGYDDASGPEELVIYRPVEDPQTLPGPLRGAAQYREVFWQIQEPSQDAEQESVLCGQSRLAKDPSTSVTALPE